MSDEGTIIETMAGNPAFRHVGRLDSPHDRLYRLQGRYAEAEPLQKRALARRLGLTRLDGRNRFRF